MSASLVGSEMCIRDRETAERLSRQDTPVLHRYVCGSRDSALGAARAVSYTHLTLPTICSV
eukprot:2312323-Alexandrium_andersonii.AAC.1